MQASMSDFYSPLNVHIPLEEGQGSTLHMLPFDSSSARWMHNCVHQWDAEAFRDHRQAHVCEILRGRKYMLAAMPVGWKGKYNEVMDPPILGYCLFRDMTHTYVTGVLRPAYQIISIGVRPDNRRMGTAIRLIRRAAMLGSRSIHAWFNAEKHLNMAALMKRIGCTVIDDKKSEGLFYFGISYERLMSHPIKAKQ